MTGMIAVTGASGFVGHALVDHLLRTGRRVRVLLHRRPLPASLTGALEVVTGGLEDEAALEALVADAEAIVHVAGRVRGRSREDFHRANALGVERLAQVTGARRRPPRFVLISSLAAREPGLSYYSASKREGEDRLAAAARGTAMACVVLRPPALYGPRDRELLPLFNTMARWGIVPLLGPPEARVSLLHVNDLAAAIGHVLSSDASGTYELHDGRTQGYSWADIATAVEEVSGRRRPGWRVRIPGGALRALGAANLLGARIFRYEPMLTPGKVNEMRHPNWICDNTAFSRDTGWRPRITLRDGLQALLHCGRSRRDEGISNVR